jgi:hypothetical protein
LQQLATKKGLELEQLEPKKELESGIPQPKPLRGFSKEEAQRFRALVMREPQWIK